MLGSTESQVDSVNTYEIISEEFQRVWSQYTNVIDIRTDGQTDDVRWQYYPYVAQKPVVAYELAVYYFNFDKSHKCKRSYTEPSNYIYYNIDENFDNEKIYRNRIGFKFKLSHRLGLSDVS